MKRTILDNMKQQPTPLLMATAQKKKLKKMPPHKKILSHRTKHTFIFFADTQSRPEKKMKECFRQRFEKPSSTNEFSNNQSYIRNLNISR